jgi:hypothetical protein
LAIRDWGGGGKRSSKLLPKFWNFSKNREMLWNCGLIPQEGKSSHLKSSSSPLTKTPFGSTLISRYLIQFYFILFFIKLSSNEISLQCVSSFGEFSIRIASKQSGVNSSWSPEIFDNFWDFECVYFETYF